MSAETEYAKVLRWYAPSSGVTGMRTTITLPTKYNSTDSVVMKGRKGNGFVNFYIAADGAGHHVECGLSINYENRQGNWHYFWTDGGSGTAGGGDWVIAPGSTVPIEVSINSSKTAIDFKVNGVTAKSFTGTFSDPATLSNVRLVIASCDQNFVKLENGKVVPDIVPVPLPDWTLLHNQVTCSNIQYRNTSNTWVTCTSTNSSPPTEELHWPIPSASHPHQGEPFNFIKQISSGQLIASLKDF
jgi:hypothetical protein